MRVLVVDDDRTTRFLLKRVLTTEFGCAVFEAGDGVEALEAMATHAFDCMLLDLRMPLMDGLETLRVLRSSSLATIPVVMLTAERDESIVRQVFDLGVVDYLTKPLNKARLVDRLKRLDRWLDSERSGTVSPSLEGLLVDTQPTVVVDGSEEIRELFVKALSPYRQTLATATGSQAVVLCVESAPGTVFIGENTGVLSGRLLVRKLRSLPGLESARLIGIVSGDDDPNEALVGRDAVISRPSTPEELLSEILALTKVRPGVIGELLRCHPTVRANLASIAEQVFGVMASLEVKTTLRSLAPDAELTMAVLRGEVVGRGAQIQLRLACLPATARELAAQLICVAPESVEDEDVVGGLSELVESIGGRLASVLGTKRFEVAFDKMATIDWSNLDPGSEGVVLHLEVPPQGWLVRLTVVSAPPAEGADTMPEPDAARRRSAGRRTAGRRSAGRRSAGR